MFHALHPYVYKEAHAQAAIIQFTNILWSMVIHHSQMETLLEQWNIYITLATIRKVGFSLLNFLSAFGFMLSSICIILSCFHFVCLFLLGCLVFFFFFQNKKRKIRRKKNTKTVCVCVCWYLCTFDGYWNKVSKLCISCSLDKHLNAQLSKWALWLVVVMSTIKIVSYISYSYHSFWRGLENPKRKT